METVVESDSGRNAIGNHHGAFEQELKQKTMFDSASPSYRKRRSTRSHVATGFDDVEFVQPRSVRRRKTTAPKVQYVETVSRTRKKKQKFQWTWVKLAWILCAILVVRLVFMERGIIDFYSKDTTTIEKQKELKNLIQENKNISAEIHRLKTSPQYQKKIAREHLGVIAADEYLILFSKE